MLIVFTLRQAGHHVLIWAHEYQTPQPSSPLPSPRVFIVRRRSRGPARATVQTCRQSPAQQVSTHSSTASEQNQKPCPLQKPLRERLNYINSPPVCCVYGKLSAEEELLRKDSGYKNILMRQGFVNDTYSRLEQRHVKSRLEFAKNWEVFTQNNDFLMVFLIQTFPQVHNWSESKLQSLANVVIFSSEENSLLSTSRKLLKLNSLFITDINHWIEVQEIAWELFWREKKPWL